MSAKFFTILMTMALFTIPTPASQPDVRVGDLVPTGKVAVTPDNFLLLLNDPFLIDGMSIELPDGFTTLETGVDPLAV